MRDNARESAKQFCSVRPRNSRQLTIRNLIANLVVAAMTAARAMNAGMRPVSSDERIHRIKPRVPEEA